MKGKKKKLAATAAILLGGSALAGCGASAEATAVNEDGAVIVELWPSSGGAAGRSLDEIIELFNHEHRGEYEVRASYQGDYGDAMAKFTASVQTGDVPGIMQANNVETAFMKDSDVIVPAEELNERYGGYDFGNVAPAIRNYYEMGGTMYAMPTMISHPILYVNNDMLAEAGLGIDDIETTDDLVAASWQIHEEVGAAGFTFPLGGWLMEQSASMNGVELCAPENGTGNRPAGEFTVDDPRIVDLWSDFGELYVAGAAHNPGQDADAATGALVTREVAIQIGSSGGLGNLMADEPDFDWSVHALPRNDDSAGVIPGGNSMWAIGLGHTERELEAAWAFLAFIGSDAMQAKIFDDTGYLPTTVGALDHVDSIDHNQQAILDQLFSLPVNTVTAGCHTGALNNALRDFERAMSKIANGADAKESLARAKEDADEKIETYNERAALTAASRYE